MHLASRGATFRLRFIQRFLTGPLDLVWRPLARIILEQCGGMGLAESLLDLSGCTLDSILCFYKGLCKLWALFKKERLKTSDSLF